ncbi:MAG: hypothetical protein ACRCYO_13410 [Bacteroidia bacterium]
MSDLHILAKKSAISNNLRNLSNHSCDLEYLVIPSTNAAQANVILAAMNQDDHISSTNMTKASGSVNGLLLPKSAGK